MARMVNMIKTHESIKAEIDILIIFQNDKELKEYKKEHPNSDVKELLLTWHDIAFRNCLDGRRYKDWWFY